jgi:AbrB family looped-hinge helix DNA binding protein
MPKAEIRGDRLTVVIPAALREEVGFHNGDDLDVSVEAGRIVLTRAAEEPLAGELEALDEAKAELAAGQTHRLDDVLDGLGRKAQ